jgi:quinol monooxygenase YgiN
MAESTPGSVHIPWYATGFRGEKLEAALAELVAAAPRYGATHYALYRSRDDRYKFLQVADFASKLDWERYWAGPEFTAFRTTCSSWFTVPIAYVWNDIVAVGGMTPSEAALEPVAE